MRARTSICWPSPARADTSARAVTPKRLAIWTQWLDATLLAPVPHRQVVRTIPKRLRASCLYRRCLLGEIARVAARTLTAAIRTLTGARDLAVGSVACVQTHGARAHGPPHRHRLVTDGGCRPDGTVVTWPVHDRARLTAAFRRAVLWLVVRLELFDEHHAAGLRTWPHAGFPVHTAAWVPEQAGARHAPHARPPTPRHHAGTFGVRDGPRAACDGPGRHPPLPGDRRSPGAAGARARRRARRPRSRGAGEADDHAVSSTDRRPTPIEIPIPSLGASRPSSDSA